MDHGLSPPSPGRDRLLEPHQVYEIGPFEVTFVPSEHSELALGLAVPNGGELTCDHVTHLGSANLIEDEICHHGVDVFLCGIAGRQMTDDYTSRILRALEPKTIVICHHDDFFRPLDAEQGLAFGVDVERFTAEVGAVSPGFRLLTLQS